jgi:hypothetical protein
MKRDKSQRDLDESVAKPNVSTISPEQVAATHLEKK